MTDVQKVVLDPTDPEFVRCPFDAYDRLREHAPVLEVGPGFYMITGRDEVRSVLRDHETFTSKKNLDGAFPFTDEVMALLSDTMFFRIALFNDDPPRQSRFKAFVADYLNPRRLAAYEQAIKDKCASLVEELGRGATAELLSQYAYPLPMAIICDMVGIPEADRPQVKQWNDMWLGLQVLPMEPEQQLGAARTVKLFEDYLRELIEARRTNLTDDLLSALIVEGDRPDGVCEVDDVLVTVRLFLAAGHETTTNVIGNTLYQLLIEPSRWAAVVDDPQLCDAAVEECLRMDSSVQGAPRFTTTDVEVAGVRIPADSRVQVVLGAVGRDPALVERPGEFELDRESRRHLAFGFGIHTCPGSQLARLEATNAIRALAAAFPRLRLAPGAEPQHLPGGFVFRGLAGLEVELDAQQSASEGDGGDGGD